MTAAIALLAPVSAGAAGSYDCDASAVRLTVLGKSLEPITAGRGSTTCQNDGRTLNDQVLGSLAAPLGLSVLPVNASVLGAETKVDGSGTTQSALATGGVTGLRIPLATLPSVLKLPTASIPDSIKSISVPLAPVKTALQSAVNPLNLLPLTSAINGLPDNVDINLESALNQLLPNGQLPTGDLINIGGAVAYATGTCSNGAPVLNGTSNVASIKVLGQEIAGQTVDQVVNLIGSGSIDPSSLSPSSLLNGVSAVQGPLGTLLALVPGSEALVNNALTAAVQSALDALPTVEVLPPTVAQVKIGAGVKTVVGDKLTQQALNVSVTVLGQKLVEGVLGEATMSKGSVTCDAAVSGQGTVAAALQCTKRRLVLTDVVQSGNRVKLTGVADPALAGKSVSLVFEDTGKTVAHATVSKAGNFNATAALPPAKVRGTNRARYQAVVGKEKSLDLKLQRRMLLSSIASKSGKVTISGRVVRPLGTPVKTITLTRRISCKHSEVVKRFKPSKDGTFKVTVDAPKDKTGAVVYRLATQVRKTTRNPKLFPTFTLPRAVELA